MKLDPRYYTEVLHKTYILAPQFRVRGLVLDHGESLAIARAEDDVLVLVALFRSAQDQRIPSGNRRLVDQSLATGRLLADDQILILDRVHAILFHGQRLDLLEHVVHLFLLVVHVPVDLRDNVIETSVR